MKTLHGYDGACIDGGLCAKTGSVGIFPLILRASGEGTKRGAVIVRVKGPIHRKGDIKAKALEIIDLLDRGEYTGPKNVTIK